MPKILRHLHSVLIAAVSQPMRHCQRGHAIIVRTIQVRVVIEQQVGDLRVGNRAVKWGVPVRIGKVRVRSGLEQESHAFTVAGADRQRQWRLHRFRRLIDVIAFGN